MKRRAWQGLTVVLALAALTAGGCKKGAQPTGQPADSLALIPSSGSPAALSDTEAGGAAAAAPTPAPKAAPAPRATERERSGRKAAPEERRAAGPSSYTAATGTRVALAVADTISSRTATAGQEFTAKVQSDVTDAAGHVVIPAGSTVTGTIAEVKPGGASNAGTLTLAMKNVTIRGTTYPLNATVESATTIQEGRGVTGKDVAKVGAGAAAGALAGRILGRSAKGTIIGGVLGAAAGAGVARATRTVDIVLPAGGHVEIALSQPITVPAK